MKDGCGMAYPVWLLTTILCRKLTEGGLYSAATIIASIAPASTSVVANFAAHIASEVALG
jgi:hypothetical protein